MNYQLQKTFASLAITAITRSLRSLRLNRSQHKYVVWQLLISVFFALITLEGSAQGLNEIEGIFAKIKQIDDRLTSYNPPGKHPGSYSFQTTERQIALAKEYNKKVSELNKLASNRLARQEQISRKIMLLKLNNHISFVKFKIYLMPFNAEGGFYNDPVFYLTGLPFATKDDYKAYLKWLPSFAVYLKYNQGLLEQGIKEKVMRPKVIVNNTLKLLKPWLVDDFGAHPFAEPFSRMPTRISIPDQEKLREEAQKIIAESILPAYRELNSFLKDKYLPASPSKEGVSNIKNGKAYYLDRVKYYTTLDLSPDSIFNLGKSEVARIKEQMMEIISDLKFEGGYKDFLEFLRTDEQFYAKTPQELLERAAWLSKKAEGQLPRLFSRLYSVPFTVEPVPDAIAPTYTTGRYVSGSREDNRAGIYWVNTYNLPSRTLYTLPALTLHEAVPGHHLDGMLRIDLDLPAFRRSTYINAYGEGWGLYAEFLGEEMGMYSTPYELFGRYTYEMWRACRLVVDVGLHQKGWSRQEAVDYMAKNTALSLHEVGTEIDRYIGWPGQALGYKIGEITIRALREEATRELGDKFDIQVFHEQVLKNGSIPLPVLIEEIRAYIRDVK